MSDEHYTSLDGLTAAYGDRSLLEKRRALYQYTFPSVTTEQAISELSLFDNNQVVLDVGCGSGALLFRLAELYRHSTYIGMDISEGILNEAGQNRNGRGNVRFIAGDAQNLALPDRLFDRVIAMHMLYHVPDIHKSLVEMGRVLKKDGKVVISANSLSSKPTLNRLKEEAAKIMERNSFPNLTARFNIENGVTSVKAHFRHVDLRRYTNQIKLSSPQPYVDYFDSTREFWYPYPSNQEWQRVLEGVHKNITSTIKDKGIFSETNTFGIIVAHGAR